MPVFERVHTLVLRVDKLSLENTPDRDLREIEQGISDLANCHQEIAAFDINQQNPAQDRQNRINTLTTRLQTIESSLARLIATTLALESPFAEDTSNPESEARTQMEIATAVEKVRAEIDADYRASLEEIQRIATGHVNAASEAAGKADAASKAAADAAKKAGVISEAKHFKDLADSNARRSYVLLGCAIVAAIVFTSLLSNSHFENPKEDATFLSYLPSLLPSLAWPVFALFLMIISIRLFSSERHNYVVNRHRQAALSTFNTLLEGATQETAKNALLVQAGTAIFTPQPSGYSKAPIEVHQLATGLLGNASKVDGAS